MQDNYHRFILVVVLDHHKKKQLADHNHVRFHITDLIKLASIRQPTHLNHLHNQSQNVLLGQTLELPGSAHHHHDLYNIQTMKTVLIVSAPKDAKGNIMLVFDIDGQPCTAYDTEGNGANLAITHGGIGLMFNDEGKLCIATDNKQHEAELDIIDDQSAFRLFRPVTDKLKEITQMDNLALSDTTYDDEPEDIDVKDTQWYSTPEGVSILKEIYSSLPEYGFNIQSMTRDTNTQDITILLAINQAEVNYEVAVSFPQDFPKSNSNICICNESQPIHHQLNMEAEDVTMKAEDVARLFRSSLFDFICSQNAKAAPRLHTPTDTQDPFQLKQDDTANTGKYEQVEKKKIIDSTTEKGVKQQHSNGIQKVKVVASTLDEKKVIVCDDASQKSDAKSAITPVNRNTEPTQDGTAPQPSNDGQTPQSGNDGQALPGNDGQALPGNDGQAPQPGNDGQAPQTGNDGQAPQPGNGGQAPQPGNDGQAPPGNYGQAPQPGNDGQAPQPGNDGQAPQPGNDGQAPPGNDGQVPPGNEEQAPPGNDGQAPQPGNDGQAPRPSNDGQAPQPGNEEQAPQPANYGQAPPGNYGQAPRPGNDGQAPPGNDGQAPPGNDGQVPPGNEEQAPQPGNDGQAPQPGNDGQAPQPGNGGQAPPGNDGQVPHPGGQTPQQNVTSESEGMEVDYQTRNGMLLNKKVKRKNTWLWKLKKE
ncbi:hypothetical protein QZH41_005393 [Actinostola sp. cb2023]|nr:hypothetical protein QZH41_005393 [Actinostola sp. cb2023]